MIDQWQDLQPLLSDELTEFADELQPLGPDEFDDQFQGSTADERLEARYDWTPRERSYVDLQDVMNANEHLGLVPKPGESKHLLLSGRYRPFSIIPAIIEQTGRNIDHLYLASLSCSIDNGRDLFELLDSGKVKHVSMILAAYFAKANPHIYDPIAAEMKRRQMPITSYRTHCKVIAMKLDDGRCFVVEGSANLRSCKTLEQAVISCDDGLYAFHRKWIEGLSRRAAQ